MTTTSPDSGVQGTVAVGMKVHNFLVLELLGAGGMGAVYKARHLGLGHFVAIKTLSRELAQNASARARFQREGLAAARIAHPHVVRVHDVGEHEGTPFLVMEYLEGEDLAGRLARESRLKVEAAIEIILPVLAAVAAGHAAGVIHRDIKPQNIFLARTLRAGKVDPKVLDFGVSKVEELDDGAAPLTATKALIGTSLYMAPEVARGSRSGRKSDQYALGLVLYECVTGRRAYSGENTRAILHNIATGSLQSPRALNPELTVAFQETLLRALAFRPEDRYPSLHAFGLALLTFAAPATRADWTELLAPDELVPQVDPTEPSREFEGEVPLAATQVLGGARAGATNAFLTRAEPPKEPSGHAPTTLGNAARETGGRIRPRSRLYWVLGAALAAAAAVIALGRPHDAPVRQSSSRTAVPANSAKSADTARAPDEIALPTATRFESDDTSAGPVPSKADIELDRPAAASLPARVQVKRPRAPIKKKAAPPKVNEAPPSTEQGDDGILDSRK